MSFLVESMKQIGGGPLEGGPLEGVLPQKIVTHFLDQVVTTRDSYLGVNLSGRISSPAPAFYA